MRFLICLMLAVAGTTAYGADPATGDWPGWRGSDRTGLSKEKGILKEWPEAGPKQLWQIKGLGTGYSTPSVSNGKIFVMGSKPTEAPPAEQGGKKNRGGSGKEFIFALNEKDGSVAWEVEVGVTAGGYPGPRSTPTIDNGVAYAISSNGILAAVAIDTGKIKYTVDFKKDFKGNSGGWAYTESPLIDGDLLICTPGATDATLVALKKADGSVVWKASTKDLVGMKRSYGTAGYSSPIVATIAGEKQYVQFVSGGVIGVSAADGKVRWHYDSPANGTANCSTPIVRENFVFAASAYGTGGGQALISKTGDDYKADEKYFIKKFQNHHGGVVLVGDYLYGTTGGSLICVDFKTGEVKWDERSVGKGSVVYVDGHLIVRGENGGIALVEANPAEYVEKGKFNQPERSSQKAWPHPVVANGKLYIRDWDILQCYDITKK